MDFSIHLKLTPLKRKGSSSNHRFSGPILSFFFGGSKSLLKVTQTKLKELESTGRARCENFRETVRVDFFFLGDMLKEY